MTKLKPGDTVRVVGERGTAKVRSILTSMHATLLEKQIGGFRNWNLDELRLVKRAKANESSEPLRNLPGRLTAEDIVARPSKPKKRINR